MKSQLIIFNLLFTICLNSQNFNDFITDVTTIAPELRQVKVDSFMSANHSFPITENTLAHFIYKGEGTALQVPGDFSGWDPKNAPMINITGTDFWYLTKTFENDARLDYKFAFNGSDWILDPHNPHTAPGGWGNNSEMRMPAYEPPAEIEYNSRIPHGAITDTIYYSSALDNSRKVQLYLPPGYDESTAAYPLLLVHDGLEYSTLSKMNNVIDNLIHQKKIRPIIALFVPPVKRTPEYIENDKKDFSEFLVNEVLAWVDTNYNTSRNPADRMVMGSSAGANISLWMATKYPESFGIAAPFSPYIEPDLQKHFESNPVTGLRIFMLNGKYDHLQVIQNCVKNFLPVLDYKGYDYEFREYNEGHSYGFWRAHIDDALIFAFPGKN